MCGDRRRLGYSPGRKLRGAHPAMGLQVYVLCRQCQTHSHCSRPPRGQRRSARRSRASPAAPGLMPALDLVNLARRGEMKNTVWRNLALVGLVLLPLGARSQEASTSAPTVAVKAGRLLDVRSGNYLQDQIILIQGDRIKSMGPSAQVQIPAGAKLIDLSNRTVLPG